MEYHPKAEEIVTRGIEYIYPDKETLKKKIEQNEQFRIYLGIDPTGPTLHLGHIIVLKKLRDLQKNGAEVVLLIGDFTALIGDPTGKDTTRPRLSPQEVEENAKQYKKQASRFLRFDGDNPARLERNSGWLAGMGLGDILEISGMVTVGQLLERDMFQKRIQSGNPVYVHEFLYPLLQGYDSVALETDAEIGGSDQLFNMLMGRTLERQMLGKEKIVIATKLLADTSGIKMGKSEGNMITLNDTAEEIFGKVMGWTDDMILSGFELITDVPLTRIAEIKESLESGVNPRDAKQELAFEVTALFSDVSQAAHARNSFRRAFQEKKTPEDIPEAVVARGALIVDTLVERNIVSSRSEFRRLVSEGAVRDMGSQNTITDPNARWEESMTLKIGKHRFLRARVEE